jgi:hypothetical protein
LGVVLSAESSIGVGQALAQLLALASDDAPALDGGVPWPTLAGAGFFGGGALCARQATAKARSSPELYASAALGSCFIASIALNRFAAEQALQGRLVDHARAEFFRGIGLRLTDLFTDY